MIEVEYRNYLYDLIVQFLIILRDRDRKISNSNGASFMLLTNEGFNGSLLVFPLYMYLARNNFV